MQGVGAPILVLSALTALLNHSVASSLLPTCARRSWAARKEEERVLSHLVKQLAEPHRDVALHGVAADGVPATSSRRINRFHDERAGGGGGMVLRALQRLRCNIQPAKVDAEERHEQLAS
jgi:hypothetical protein